MSAAQRHSLAPAEGKHFRVEVFALPGQNKRTGPSVKQSSEALRQRGADEFMDAPTLNLCSLLPYEQPTVLENFNLAIY